METYSETANLTPADIEDQPAPEPLFSLDHREYGLLPIRYPKLWDAYKRSTRTLWTPNDFVPERSKDMSDWSTTLQTETRSFAVLSLAFFLESLQWIPGDLTTCISDNITAHEAKSFFRVQLLMETIHVETISTFASIFSLDEEVQHDFSGMVTDSLLDKRQWLSKWTIDSSKPVTLKLIAFCAAKGLFFSSLGVIFGGLEKMDILNDFCHYKNLIFLDLEVHMDFGCLIFGHLHQPPNTEQVHQIVIEAVDMEKSFIFDLPPIALIHLTFAQIHQYIEFLADRLIIALGYEPIFNSTNPFNFMRHPIPADIKAQHFVGNSSTIL